MDRRIEVAETLDYRYVNQAFKNSKGGTETKMKEAIQAAIDQIRPNLQADGGDVELVSVDDAVVKVRLQGACKGCPMSQMTLKNGIEKFVKERVPEVDRVEAVD